MALSSPGIGSNLDVNSIVQQLMAVESQPLVALAKKEASYQAKLSAYGNLSSALTTFQTALAGLTNSSKFQSLNASSGDATVVTGTASSQATAGSYNVTVSTVAQSQTIATAGQSNTTGAIGAGASTTLTFQFGTIGGGTTPADGLYPTGTTFTQDGNQASGTVTIDSTNNSLQGIRDAINKANVGVTATIVSDGSPSPHRLVLTSTKTGVASSMKISVAGDAALSDLLSYDASNVSGQKMTQTAVAQDTAATVNGIAITRSTKTIADAIQGVTLTVSKAGTTTLSVARDNGTATATVTGFVKAYNELHKSLKELSSYNADTKVGGPLVGDSTARAVQADMRRILNTSLPELQGKIRTLSDIGISFQKDGTLATDATKLQNAITNHFTEIASLFAAVGTASDSLVSVSGSGAKTKSGQYAVELTAVATRGSLTGTVNLNSASTVIDDGTKINVTLDGTTATVALTAGTYTATQFAAMLQSAINGTSSFSSASASATAAIDGSGSLAISSNRYGSESKVTISSSSGTLADVFIGAAPALVNGVDVAGTIGGITATGSGQTLAGASGTAIEGLKVVINGGSTGTRGVIRFSRGYADQLTTGIDSFLGSNGLISDRTKGINNSIKDLGKSREALAMRLQDVEKRYRAQFAALDKMISSMSSTTAFLQQQLANLPKIE